VAVSLQPTLANAQFDLAFISFIIAAIALVLSGIYNDY